MDGPRALRDSPIKGARLSVLVSSARSAIFPKWQIRPMGMATREDLAAFTEEEPRGFGLHPVTSGFSGKFCPARYSELGKDVGEVGLHRSAADEKPLADLRVG